MLWDWDRWAQGTDQWDEHIVEEVQGAVLKQEGRVGGFEWRHFREDIEAVQWEECTHQGNQYQQHRN